MVDSLQINAHHPTSVVLVGLFVYHESNQDACKSGAMYLLQSVFIIKPDHIRHDLIVLPRHLLNPIHSICGGYEESETM